MVEIENLLIPIFSVLLSGIVGLTVAKIQIQAALKKLDVEYRRKAIEQLHQKRMEVYPILYSILLAFIKNRFNRELVYEDLAKLLQNFDEWEISNSIFVSPIGLEKIERAKKLFKEVLNRSSQKQKLSNNSIKKIVPELYSLQMTLKTELGVLDADCFHNPKKIKHLNEILKNNPNGNASSNLNGNVSPLKKNLQKVKKFFDNFFEEKILKIK